MAGKRLALIVATDQYRDPGLRQLRAPGTDAEALAKVLGDPELGEFEVEVLRNETSSMISERVEATLSGGRPEDLIVLHFSCHGLKDDSGELYLAATNTRPALLASTAVDSTLVNRLMRRSRANRIVLFLDCCYGGAFERGMAPRAAGVVDVADQFQQREAELSSGRGRVVITASNAMEFAFEGTDLADAVAQQPSIFTGALVEGLTTGAADRDQDGMVSLAELYDYVFERVRQESPNQTPGKWEFGLQGDLILAKNPQRVVVAAPVPAELLELIEHPFPATRLGSVDALTRLAEGANLPIAAGARAVLERMVNDDSRAVAAAATEAVAKTGIRLSPTEVDLGTVEVGGRATADVTIEGVPLATASRVEASIPSLRVRRIERTIRIELDTAAEGSIDGIVTASGPAGTAQVRVVGMVGAAEVAEAASSPGAGVDGPVEVEPVDAAPVDAAPVESAPVQPVPDPVIAPAAVAAPTVETPAVTPPTAPARPEDSLPSFAPMRAEAQPGQWSFPAAAARGIFGNGIAWLIAIQAVAVIYYDGDVGVSIDSLSWAYVAFDMVAFTVAVVFLEGLVPSARVPDGALYWAWRGRHVVAAAIQGAALGVTVGLFVGYLRSNDFPPPDVYLYVLTPAIGFALAEAVIQRLKTRT
jgi:hypothetical protein